MSEDIQPLTREEWYQRIRETGKREAIKAEMLRLGFWKEIPLSEEETQKAEIENLEIKELQSELGKLKKESSKLDDVNLLLKKARQKRIEESQVRRAERKKEREKAIKEAKVRWKQYQESHLIHLGEGVSAGLEMADMDVTRLQSQELPVIFTAEQLAEEMDISLSCLKWLTYHRNLATLSHYYQFTIPKKRGGLREISAPKKQLRQAQSWVKEQILDRLPVHQVAYGFVPGRSTVDHANVHVGHETVVKMDLQEFFPTITFFRVRGLFESFGYSRMISTVLALLCTEPPRQKVTFDGKFYYVSMDERQLPQGACTSPAITNLICRRLDERLLGLAEKERFSYSRYADDLTFSTPVSGNQRIGALIGTVRHIVNYEGFKVNEEKTKVLRASGRQQVTGIIVNEKANISRDEQKRFRAILHNVEKNGIEAENKTKHPDFWSYLQGYASYAVMVSPQLGEKWKGQLAQIAQKYGV